MLRKNHGSALVTNGANLTLPDGNKRSKSSFIFTAFINNIAKRAAFVASFVVFSLFMLPQSAWAVDQESFGGMANNIVQQGGPGAKVVLVLALIVGLATIWAGGKKIIAASDSQGREPFGPGITRCCIGGLLCVLSTFALYASHTFTDGNTTSVSVGTVNGLEGGD